MSLSLCLLALVLTPAQEATLAKLVKDSGVPSASVAIVRDDQIVYAKTFGAATTATRYFVGSVSKQFTVAAILLAQEEGKLTLDDRVSRYYPELTRAKEITLRQLLSHTSGYEDYAPQDYTIPAWTRPIAPDDLIHAWAEKPLDYEPGAKWQYSNTGYVLAARILEKAIGRSLVDYLGEKVFRPLGMSSAGDGFTAPTAADAKPYTRFGLGPARPVQHEAPGWYYGAAELAMTPTDLARWDVALLQRKLLSPASYQALSTETLLTNGDHTGYSLGLQIGQMDRILKVGHSGEVAGFLTQNVLFPTRNAAVVVCTNQDGVFVFSTLADKISRWLVEPDLVPPEDAPPAELKQVRGIVEQIASGQLNLAPFTEDMKAYFSPEARHDLQASLVPLGGITKIERTRTGLRGGMTYRNYKLTFAKGAMDLSVYVASDGRFEQFLLSQDF